MKEIKESTVKRVTYILIFLFALGVGLIFRHDIKQWWDGSKIKNTLSGLRDDVSSGLTSAGKAIISPITHTETLDNIDSKDTTQIVYDSIRHYYPVMQGETLKIAYSIRNKSDKTIVIEDIQTSCGCIVPRDELPIFILAGTTGYIHADFKTEKNTGYVCHYIDCIGNFTNTHSINIGSTDHPQLAHYIELRFDTNIVPPADYIHDYEEIWHEQSDVDGTIRDFVDGTTSQKNYWTDKDVK